MYKQGIRSEADECPDQNATNPINEKGARQEQRNKRYFFCIALTSLQKSPKH